METDLNTQPPPPIKDMAGEAIYPGKEAWKNEPGNRYTAEELREMERNWNIRVSNPHKPASRRGD